MLLTMKNGKVPGPDGFSVGFFKFSWAVVGDDFCFVVSHFFDSFYFPPGLMLLPLRLSRNMQCGKIIGL